MNIFERSFRRITTSAHRRILPCATACIGLALSSQASARESVLPANGVLLVGQRLVDPNCYYHLDMQADANLVVYAGSGTSHPIWANNESGNIGGYYGNDPNQAYVILQLDGNFVEYVPDEYSQYTSHAIWASNTDNGRAEILAMQEDGNVVIYPTNVVASPSTKIWASGSSGVIHPAPPGGACSVESSYTRYEEGMLVSGTRLPEVPATYTWTQCGEVCVKTAGCTAFQYFTYADQIPAGCILYEGVTRVSPAAGYPADSIAGTIVSSF